LFTAGHGLVGTDVDFLFRTWTPVLQEALASNGSDLALSGQAVRHRPG